MGEPATVYRYTDHDGNVLYAVERHDNGHGKTFRQKRPDGKGGWVYRVNRVMIRRGEDDVRDVPYRLPEVLAARDHGETVYVVEGEKCADALAAVGLVATTGAGGAGRMPTWAFADDGDRRRAFDGARVVVLPDNDDPGSKHAYQVADFLRAHASSVRVVELPGLPEKGDVVDWLRDGHTVDVLRSLADKAPEWQVSPRPPDAKRRRRRSVDDEDDPVERLRDALEERGLVVRDKGGGGFMAQCPAHEDANPSLSVDAAGEERAVVHCFAGCPTEEVVDSLGLVMADLFARRSGATKGDGSTSPEDFFGHKDGLRIVSLVEAATAGTTIHLGHDRRLYRYTDGVYTPDGADYVRGRVRELLGERARRRHIDEVVAHLRDTSPSWLPPEPPAETLNAANGLLDWRTGELRPHSPEHPSSVRIPVRWVPGARCPAVERFLADVLPGDAVDMVVEVLGYAMYPGNPLRKAVQLLGPGGNGKSKLLGLVRALVGPANTAAVTLQALGENRFSAAELYGRLANVCGDLDARAVKRTDLFKQVTGGDPITAEHKYGQPFVFTCMALPIFSANEPPLSSDQTDAWFDRWVIVPMERRFEGSDQDDPHILDKVTTPKELEGLLVLAVEGLRRLMARGRFDRPASVRAAGEAYRDRLDTVRAFVGEECRLDLEAWTKRSELYREYKRWCGEGGRMALSAATFGEHVRRNYPQVQVTTRRGDRGYAGIAVAPPPH